MAPPVARPEAPPDDDGEGKSDEPLPDLARAPPVRGRALGLFGPTSRVRRAM
jgi:hypothetical protein